jgi:preprotein translocase subunit SecE
MAKTGPLQFLQEVRAEGAKVTWPSRRETLVTTVMVVAMAVFASVFFLLADQIISRLVGLILGLGH